jgi:hypothetical protein
MAGTGVSCVLAVATGAHANLIKTFGPGFQEAVWVNMIDFDQRRALLPNTGRMYCVPASAIDIMAYIAHHGYPGVNPGDKSVWEWMSAVSYNPVTSWIQDMGNIMGTHEDNGTNGTGQMAGINAYLSGQPFISMNYWVNGNTTPRYSDVRQFTFAGVPTTTTIGWYAGTEPVINRAGGHVVATGRILDFGPSQNIGFRDPASEQTILFTQSPFSTETYVADPRPVFVAGAARTMDKIVSYGSGYLDGVTAYMPLQGLTTSDDSLNLKLHKPSKFSWDLSDITDEFLAGTLSGPVLSLEQVPGSLDIMYLVDNSALGFDNEIWKFDPVFGTNTKVMDAPNATDITFGRNRELYTREPMGVRMFDIQVDPVVQLAIMYPPDPIKSMAYDDTTDTMVMMRETEGMIYRFPSTLDSDPVDIVFYPPDPFIGGTDSIAVSPVDGSIFFTNTNLDSIYRIPGSGGVRAEPEVIMGGQLFQPRSLNVGDNGQLYASVEGIIREFYFSDANGEWIQDTNSPFDGLPAGPSLHIPHSRNNYDPAVHPFEQHVNVLPTEFADETEFDCLADLNVDQSVDGSDLGLLLSNWGTPGGPEGDMDLDGDVDGADLGLFLAAWGACP